MKRTTKNSEISPLREVSREGPLTRRSENTVKRSNRQSPKGLPSTSSASSPFASWSGIHRKGLSQLPAEGGSAGSADDWLSPHLLPERSPGSNPVPRMSRRCRGVATAVRLSAGGARQCHRTCQTRSLTVTSSGGPSQSREEYCHARTGVIGLLVCPNGPPRR